MTVAGDPSTPDRTSERGRIMINTPDGLPALSRGAHDPHEGRACFMEYASLLAGEDWSDSPACTHPVIASMARAVNDRLPDSERHKIAHLIPDVIGTADTRDGELERRRLSVRLAVWCARQVVQHVRPRDQAAVVAAIDAAEAWAEEPSAANAAYAAAYAANAAAYAYLPDLLTGLLAEHKRLTGHTPTAEVRQVWESTNFQQLITR